jgi:hypothetical protein
MEPITMIYNDMWVMYSEGKLRFYSMKNGTLINTLLLRLCSSRHISLVWESLLIININVC